MFDKASINKRIWVNTFAQIGSKFFSILLSLLTVSLLTRHLGTEGYGNFVLVFTYLSFFAVLSDVGFNQIIVREFSSKKNSAVAKASFLNFKIILNALSILLPLFALAIFPYSDFVKIAILIGALATGAGNMVSYGSSILQSQLRLDLLALLELLIKVVSVALIYWFTRIQGELYSMIGAILIGNSLGLCISYLLVRKQINFRFYLDLSLVKRLLKLGFPVGMSSFLALLYFKVDTLLLSIIRSPEEVGIYSLSYKILENVLMLWGLYMASIYPLWVRYFSKNDHLAYKNLLKSALIVLGIFSVVVIFVGQIFTPLIMSTLGGNEFFLSEAPFKILLWTVPFLFLNNIFYNMALSFGKTKYLIYPLLLSLVISILLNLYAIPKYGYIGASVTTVITEIFISLSYIFIFWRYFEIETSKYVK